MAYQMCKSIRIVHYKFEVFCHYFCYHYFYPCSEIKREHNVEIIYRPKLPINGLFQRRIKKRNFRWNSQTWEKERQLAKPTKLWQEWKKTPAPKAGKKHWREENWREQNQPKLNHSSWGLSVMHLTDAMAFVQMCEFYFVFKEYGSLHSSACSLKEAVSF